jgi:predicted acylesterase/phospholipase RssA
MVEKENKRRHRALILQGGGALGAYEEGAFRAPCSWLKRDDNNNNTSDDEHIFDIIAGTSIGAINAAIIVSNVKENKTWNYSADRLWELSLTDMSDVLFDFNICAFACQVVACQKKDDIYIQRGQTSFYE